MKHNYNHPFIREAHNEVEERDGTDLAKSREAKREHVLKK
jgi:hypothetical protein